MPHSSGQIAAKVRLAPGQRQGRRSPARQPTVPYLGPGGERHHGSRPSKLVILTAGAVDGEDAKAPHQTAAGL